MAHASFARARLQATVAFVGGLVLWWRFGSGWSMAAVGVLAVLALLAWLAPERHQPVQHAFDWLTRRLVAGFTWLILGVVYFGLFTPIRLLGALTGRDALGQKPNRSVKTFLRPLPPVSTGRFGRQF
jgi:hypothetical protein